MATIQDRTFSVTYSGLKNQFALAGVLAALCLTGYELMRRQRRGRGRSSKYSQNLGSVETWEFGYLYQGRCWARLPSPALPQYPLQWVTQALSYPESDLPKLIGVDASLYIRFIQGCRLFVFLHILTTFPIIFTVHIVFSPSDIPISSMDKASISSLVPSEQQLLYIHVILAYWIAITWLLNLLWIARDTFRFRAQATKALSEKYSTQLYQSVTSPFGDHNQNQNRGVRLRTVMVTNIPVSLRTEKDLKEYFEYYLSKPLAKPPIAFSFFTRIASAFFHRVTPSSTMNRFKAIPDDAVPQQRHPQEEENASFPMVERVVIARKTTELASLLERRDAVLKELEYAHIQLARNVLQATRDTMDNPKVYQDSSREEKEVWSALFPFVKQFRVPPSTPQPVHSIVRYTKRARQFLFHRKEDDVDVDVTDDKDTLYTTASSNVHNHNHNQNTIWEALYNLPRSHLDLYQPLTYLNKLFLGKPVPEIDYYTTRLTYLTSLIHDDKSLPVEDYQPTSTAFVTFAKIADARRATKFLQTHPTNPLACLVVPAPDVRDLDWGRIMKSSFTGEFIKDWVIDAGVWAFTLSWIIPISLLIGLVNIQNLSVVIPGLANYFNKHPHDKDAISSLLPTVIFSLLTILIPVLLFLIGKKGHTIVTFSKLHDTIMTRYWKFLVCNLLIFFCVGVAALESFLEFFKHSVDVVSVIAGSFPVAGPFYVGWLILQTAVHGSLELGLFGLPLIVYPSTKVSKTLRRRAEGIRPRTFNFYYWLPNHLLVITIVLVFSLLNPLVIPFALVYFCVESVIVKHQLLFVYSRSYENNGKILLIRMIRFSLDGLLVAHVVLLAFLVVLKETPEAAFIGILLVLTVFVKLGVTRICRIKFAEGDKAEEVIFDDNDSHNGRGVSETSPLQSPSKEDYDNSASSPSDKAKARTAATDHFARWKELPKGHQLSYASYPPRRQFDTHRPGNPFQPSSEKSSSTPVNGDSLHPLTLTNGSRPQQPSITTSLSHNDQQWQSTNKPTARSHSAVVTPRPPFPPWDDSPDLDQPYDNPFYRAPIDTTLWLPRNPFGILDLDDTVDLHVSLTSSGNFDKLDRWLDDLQETEETAQAQQESLSELGHPVDVLSHSDNKRLTDSPRMTSIPSVIPEEDELGRRVRRQTARTDSDRTKGSSSSSKLRPRRQYTGMENISMSSVLAARANALEKEKEKENNRRKRNIIPDVVKGHNNKQFDIDGQDLVNVLSIETTTSATSDRPRDRHPRLRSWTYDPVHEPDLHAESAPLRGESVHLASLVEDPHADETAGRQQDDARASENNTISLGEAVLGEVVAEEQHYAIERVRREFQEKRMWERLYKPSWWRGFFWHTTSGDRRDPDELREPESVV